MDRKILIENLNKVFCDTNKERKRYSRVWLTDADFGGLYRSGKYVLNVKAEHEIENCYDEISDILDLLDKVAKEELRYIFRVVVYNFYEEIHCHSSELVYTEENACP